MTLDEARSELAARGFDYLTASRMTLMLNDAKNAFEDAWRFPWLEVAVPGTPPLLIADLKYILYVQDIDRDVELLGLDVRDIAQDGSPVDLVGTPRYWWLDGPDAAGAVTLRTWPVATPNLQVRYVRESPELSAPSSTPLIPARYHSIWIDLAVIQAYHDSDNFSGAQALQADVNARLLSVIERYETRNRQNGPYLVERVPLAEDA